MKSSRHDIDRNRAQALFANERAAFAAAHPRSHALSVKAAQHLLFGVPLHWMNDWSTPFSLYVERASGAHIEDVDGHRYADFCLGDTGAMFGHAPPPVVRALAQQAERGLTTMLPSADAPWVASELARRFGLPYWQFAMTATDANRFVIRWARAVTGRPKILIFNGCYHGTVDEVFVDLIAGRAVQRDSLLGQASDLTTLTQVVEFNDLAALDAALAGGEVAVVLAEPVMTNIGMVLPDAGYWEQAQKIIRRHGSLLAIDETHTISTGVGGYTQAHGLVPDFFVLGKPIGGGFPCAVYGFSTDLAARAQHAKRVAPPGHSGIGTTLTANLLAMAAMRATLDDVMTAAAYAHMFKLAERLGQGLTSAIKKAGLPWCVTQVGARTEFQFSPHPPRNGSEAAAILDEELEHVIHLYLLNRGLLITPFHNMMLVCPDTTSTDVDKLIQGFTDFVAEVA